MVLSRSPKQINGNLKQTFVTLLIYSWHMSYCFPRLYKSNHRSLASAPAPGDWLRWAKGNVFCKWQTKGVAYFQSLINVTQVQTRRYWLYFFHFYYQKCMERLNTIKKMIKKNEYIWKGKWEQYLWFWINWNNKK